MGPINLFTTFQIKVITGLAILGLVSGCGYILYAAWYVVAHLSWSWN